MTTANKTFSLDAELIVEIGKISEKEKISESSVAEKLLKAGVLHITNCEAKG